MLSQSQTTGRSIIDQLEFEQEQKVLEQRSLPDFSPGDTIKAILRVREGSRERLQAFEGVCIAQQGRGINSSFTLRKISHGEGVERVIPFYSPLLHSVEVTRRGKVRRAKLYYLRGRQGKAARIEERQEQPTYVHKRDTHSMPTATEAAPHDGKPQVTEIVDKVAENGHSAGGSIEPSKESSLLYQEQLSRDRYQSMVSALKRLQTLEDRAEGPQVRDAVAAAVRELPDVFVDSMQVGEFALLLGEYLCPLMFSTDENVSSIARSGVSKIGSLVSQHDATPDGHIVEALASLELSAIITLDLDVADAEAKLGVTAGDVFKEAVGKARRERPSIHLQVLVEDMKKRDISALADFDVPSDEKTTVSSVVSGDLKNKLITVIANGIEIFSARMNKKYRKILLC